VPLLSPRFFRPKSRSRSASDARGCRPHTRVPALLVSVRNGLEARAAIVGGCDLLDIKEPSRGPLGMADRPVMAAIAEIAASCRGTAARLPCSAALGELRDWESQPGAPVFAVPAGIGYLKLGAAGIASAERWIAAWRLVRGRLGTPPGSDVQWVAVAYADWRQAQSLEPLQLLAAARVVNCSVLLLDTFDKRAGNLLEVADCSTLRRLVDAARETGLKVALAGGLRRPQLAELAELSPDLVGVRSAACAGGRRTNPVSAGAVRALKRELIATFAADSEP
jgi:(5-formylfuran-3-yl)methyl phosphate synthase